MLKTRKVIALVIAITMLMSNMSFLLGNVSMAIPNTITVEFSVDNDGAVELRDEGTVINYTCSDNSSYDFKLVQNGVPIPLQVQNDPQNGDKYIATGITSNENVQIYSEHVNLGMVEIFYGGMPIAMVPENEDEDYYSSVLRAFEDSDYYQFRIQEKQQGGEQPQGQDLSNVDFTIDFGTGSWTVNEQVVTATIGGNPISGATQIKGNTEITLSNYNPETMDVRVDEQVEQNPFGTTLRVDQNGVTRIVDHNAGNLPQGPFVFSVVEHHDENQDNPPPPMEETNYTVNFGEATWVVRNETTQASIEGLDITNGDVEIRGDTEITLTNWQPDLMQAAIIVHNQENMKIRLNVDVDQQTGNGRTRIMDIQADGFGYTEGELVEFLVEPYEGERPEYNLPPANTSANVSITSPNGYNGSYANAFIAINDFPINLEPVEGHEEDPIPEVRVFEDFQYAYDENQYDAPNTGKVKISLGSIFDHKYVGAATIVGKYANDDIMYTETINIADYINYADRQDWLDHYSSQTVGFDIYVDKADKYEFIVSLEEMVGADIAIGNFLWSYEEDGAGHDGYVGNSRLEVLSVTYWVDDNHDGEEEEYTVTGEAISNDKYIEYGKSAVIESLVVPEGSRVTMKIRPYYGYQVLTVGSNDNPIITGDNISEFTFPAHKGNFHLGAQVVEVDNVVDALSEKVKSGSVEIGQNEINSGSVVLTVNDANPSEEKINGFTENAGDYTIESYLDINLDQIIYKGTADNVWANEIHELNEEATIELELEEDLDNKNIIIVHNIDDGEEYEVINIERYDPETKTVTFKAQSFSGYAIATKDKENQEEQGNENNQGEQGEQGNENNQGEQGEQGNQGNENSQGNQEEEEPAVAQEKYTITEGDFTVIFSDDEGHEFELTVMELMNLTDEQLAEMELSKEEYEQAKKELIEALKDYGTILNVYEISIDDEDEHYSHFGEVTVRIKMTDEMKKYNTFKLICIDNDTIGKNDVVNLKAVNGYLEGNLFHLSNYALVASNVEDEDESSNPKTGDTIIATITIFTISTFGLLATIKISKRNKNSKH